ncbi:hypothetical protein H5410_025197 [Solanum commersonii]|uniref:F-box domain-containing protein n=1 Tax=Solanum commersonii TaxID=4109 RepID=A0A9J5YT35_SOLCO|nr:hypothetical protein H5410_025197 [Solanum commersonii]
MDVKISKGKEKRICQVTRMRIMDLPLVIMIDILSRLPIKSIFRCKCVCKVWYNILYPDPLFVSMYEKRSLKFPCILLLEGIGEHSLLELKEGYHYYYGRSIRPIPLIPKFHYPPGRVSLVGSCNGLICLLNDSMYIEKHSIYISNPLLGEYFEVKLPKREISVNQVTYGFCFSEVSREYKVLRLVVREHIHVSELKIYTLGVGEKWRNVGEIPCPTRYKFGQVIVNGALHWMYHEENDKIYSFGIETEKIKSLPAPPGLGTPPWILKLAEYGVAESWTKDTIMVNSLPRDFNGFNINPILIWKDGEILIQNFRCLASYRPESKRFIRVKVYGDVSAATRYIPSFYSLKTIMGENFQVTNVYPKPKIL